MLGALGDIAERVPGGVAEWAGEIADQVRANPELQRILVVIGMITAAIFVFGIIKQAFKAAVIGGILTVVAWFWYFNVR
jgi:hypothetical protein